MNKYVFYIVLGISVFFTSCIPTQDLIYLQKKEGSKRETSISAVVAKPYRLQTNDVLSIAIKANDPKLVAMFNVSDQAGITTRTDSGLYFDGFTVDDHGNIRIPVLGEINVMGLTLDQVRIQVEKQLLSDYFNAAASIFVTVKLAGFKYTINGEVGVTGTKTLFQDHVNILEAIANSGDHMAP